MTARGARGGFAALALAAAGWSAAPAAAHVTVYPGASRPGELQRYRVLVPSESDRPVRSVDLRLPEGFEFVLVEEQGGWSSRQIRRDDMVQEIRWQGRIQPGGFAELRFIARNPVRTGTLSFKAVQRYEGGLVQRWIGPPDSDEPAPVVELRESAAPVDVVSTDGEELPAAGRPPARAAAEASDPGRDGLTLGLATGGLACGLLAFGLALRGSLSRRTA